MRISEVFNPALELIDISIFKGKLDITAYNWITGNTVKVDLKGLVNDIDMADLVSISATR